MAIDASGTLIEVRVLPSGERAARVEICCPEGEPSFTEWMAAAEYLTAVVARKSHAGYERAVELVGQGALTYRHETWKPPEE